MRRALDQFVVEGIKTSIPLHQQILRDPGSWLGSSRRASWRGFSNRANAPPYRERRAPQGLYALADGEALGGVEKVAVAVPAIRAGRGRSHPMASRNRLRSAALAVVDRSGPWLVQARRPRSGSTIASTSAWRSRPWSSPGPARRRARRDARRLVARVARRSGQSTHDRAQVEAAAADPAVDWIAVGPVCSTRSKVEDLSQCR